MKILRIYPFLPPLRGGMEKHVFRLTEEQRKLGCSVTIAFSKGEPSSSTDIPILSRINLRKIKPQVLRDILFFPCLIFVLFKKKKRFDVIHVHGDWSAFLITRLVAFTVKADVIIGSLHDVSRKGGWWKSIYRFSLKDYSFLYTTGAQDASYLSSFCHVPVYWQHSGIDSDVFKKDDNVDKVFDIVCVGSFVRKKNYELIIKIACLLPGYKFVLVGEGPLRVRIEDLCRQYNLENVTFTGELSKNDVASILQKSRVFLLTSFKEGTPTVVLEAMACGLPVVISCSNNFEDLIESEKNGYVIDSFCPEPYAVRIKGLLNNQRKMKEISDINKNQATNYDWPQVARKITNLLLRK